MVSQKPTIIGLYGPSGSGKSYWKQHLGDLLPGDAFSFFEGADVIARLVDGGLDAFKKLDAPAKTDVRQRAIDEIKQRCAQDRVTGVVTGHFMFWNAGDEVPAPVWNERDQAAYTHIIYLDTPAADVHAYRSKDNGSGKRAREEVSVQHLEQWMAAEKAGLREICRDNGILFVALNPTNEDMLVSLLRDFCEHDVKLNLARATARLDDIVKDKALELRTALVFDGDKTLCEGDAGTELYKHLQREGDAQALLPGEIFSSCLQYSYTAFRQAALLLDELILAHSDPLQVLDAVARTTTLHPELVDVLRAASTHTHVTAVIVTCGPRALWERILDMNGLSSSVQVIGSGSGTNGCVVTADVKVALVRHLQTEYQATVCAFGDSTLDLPMLRQANRAVVVVGPPHARSRSMESALCAALHDGLHAEQTLLPPGAHNPPRLNTSLLPVLDVASPAFQTELFARPKPRAQTLFAPRGAAQLLMTPTRDAALSGPALRAAHQRVGWFLATRFLPDVLGLEQYDIAHVQGGATAGFRLRGERSALVVPLMRGGEPMALGVAEAVPGAGFVHAKVPGDLSVEVMRGRGAVVLVDSVVNTGRSLVPFVERVRELGDARIVVVAGVVQAGALEGGEFARMLAPGGDVSLVALRVSQNKYTGRGGTDTGHRLFNTTYLD